MTQIARAVSAEGVSVSARTAWSVLGAEGHERGAAPRTAPVRTGALPARPADGDISCEHAALCLPLPAIAEFGLE